MAIKSDNTQGNPYHDERNGQFTSQGSGGTKSTAETNINEAGVKESGFEDWFSDSPEEDDNELEEQIKKYEKLSNNSLGISLLEKTEDMKEACKSINPNYNTKKYKYLNNCTYCTIAYEFRRRGLNVEADGLGNKGYTNLMHVDDYGGLNTLLEQSGAKTFRPMIRDVEKLKKYTLENMLAEGDGARFKVGWKWKYSGGHSTVAEVHDGNVYFVDPQDGSITENDSDYFDRCNTRNFYFIRMDNVELDTKKFEEALIEGEAEDDD